MAKSYIYHFAWQDENGKWCGWNEVWATNMAQARKEARKMESPAKLIAYDVIVNGAIEQATERFKGMYINPKSFKRITVEKSVEHNRMANLMSR